MFFRLCNSSLTFQAMMNNTLKGEIKEGLCIVYTYGQHPYLHQEQRRSQMLHQTCSWKPLKSWPLPQTIKMQILQNEDQIPLLLLKKARWWWTPWNSMESVTGQSPRVLNKCAPSLDLETFIDASFRNSPNLPNPWTNSSRKTNLLFGMMLLNKPLMKWRNASPKNQSSWCQIKPDPSRSNVMHWNMHPVQSLCNSTPLVIDTHVPSYHRPSPW